MISPSGHSTKKPTATAVPTEKHTTENPTDATTTPIPTEKYTTEDPTDATATAFTTKKHTSEDAPSKFELPC